VSTAVTVTWMDGRQETYACDDYRVREGVLWLDPPRRGAVEPKRRIPLANVRIWTE
jgi:hypothetical protein